ncbi:hypothetical protein D9M68_998950 [compost metagenome]
MEGEKARRGIERALRGSVDIALVQIDALGQRAKGLPGLLKHGGRRIYTVKGPAGMGLGEGFEFQPTASAQHQHAAGFGHALGQ